MIACPHHDELRRYLIQDETLDDARIDWIVEHVETCAPCRKFLNGVTDDDVPSGTTIPLLPGYRIDRYLGAGAFGEVWLAQDLNLPRLVAVKTLKAGDVKKGLAGALEVLRQDAALLTRVDHPNVVRVHAWLTVRDQHFLVMQYVAGGSLADLVRRQGSIDWQRAAGYAADVGEGLLKVHACGIVHRDVKPSNILWDPATDEAILTDFGVASRLSEPAPVAGSIPYMAFEAFDGHVSPALDVYSLAATLFHLGTGFTPFAATRIGALKQEIHQGLPEPDPRCAGLPEPLERIIRDGLAADPRHRPSLKDFVLRLRGTLNQLMADTFAMPSITSGDDRSTELATGAGQRPTGPPTTEREPAPHPGPVELRLLVSREVGPNIFVPIAATHPRAAQAGSMTRDMKKVPPTPDQVRLRTGDRVRIEVSSDLPGFLTVFNVGPTGNLNLLYPDGDPRRPGMMAPIEANRLLRVVDVEMTPPTGPERLLAVWTVHPLSLTIDQLHGVVDNASANSPASRPYVATRDMKRVQQCVQQMVPDEWHAVVLELEHGD